MHIDVVRHMLWHVGEAGCRKMHGVTALLGGRGGGSPSMVSLLPSGARAGGRCAGWDFPAAVRAPRKRRRALPIARRMPALRLPTVGTAWSPLSAQAIFEATSTRPCDEALEIT